MADSDLDSPDVLPSGSPAGPGGAASGGIERLDVLNAPAEAPGAVSGGTGEEPAYWLASAEMGTPTVGGEPAPTALEPASTVVVATMGPATGPETRPPEVPVAAPGRVLGIRRAESTPAAGTRRPRRLVSAARRLSALLVLLLVVGIIGYGLAFLSAALLARQYGTGVPSAVDSAVPMLATALASAPPSPAGPSVTPSASFSASPAASSAVHVVLAGENLTVIARRYGVSVQALAAANGITDLNTIYVGQRLAIPAPQSSAGDLAHRVTAR
ncbi:MAG: LysM peptidoglycan-binding domain-containing protein [Candidatus Limnocylindrales bacterium]|jgi:LysM repeat protein